MEHKFTDQNFETEVIKFPGAVLVDFFAVWCGPCQMLGPIVEKLAEVNKDKNVKIGKVNVDENPELANKYEIMSVPTILLFKNGKIVKTLNGVNSQESLQTEIDQLI